MFFLFITTTEGRITMKDTWSITEEEKTRLIKVLTDELIVLRTKAGVSQDEIAKIIGVSRQTYGDIERKKRQMSWSTYLSLILFFDYTKSTHKLIRSISAFPSKLLNCFDNKEKSNNLENELNLDMVAKEINKKLDEKALYAIRTVVMLEYARCSNLSNDLLMKSLDSKIFSNSDDEN